MPDRARARAAYLFVTLSMTFIPAMQEMKRKAAVPKAAPAKDRKQ